MTNFNPVAFITGITLSRFINNIDRFDEPILYDIICHNEKNRFAVTFGYYHHELYSEGSYTSTLYEKACKAHVVSAFYRDDYTVNINGKPAKKTTSFLSSNHKSATACRHNRTKKGCKSQ